jgi:hypothetical protein
MRARAPGGDGDAISILGSAKEVAEGCCRRCDEARAAPVRAARGGGNSGEGVAGVGPDQLGGLGEEVRK